MRRLFQRGSVENRAPQAELRPAPAKPDLRRHRRRLAARERAEGMRLASERLEARIALTVTVAGFPNAVDLYQGVTPIAGNLVIASNGGDDVHIRQVASRSQDLIVSTSSTFANFQVVDSVEQRFERIFVTNGTQRTEGPLLPVISLSTTSRFLATTEDLTSVISGTITYVQSDGSSSAWGVTSVGSTMTIASGPGTGGAALPPGYIRPLSITLTSNPATPGVSDDVLQSRFDVTWSAPPNPNNSQSLSISYNTLDSRTIPPGPRTVSDTLQAMPAPGGVGFVTIPLPNAQAARQDGITAWESLGVIPGTFTGVISGNWSGTPYSVLVRDSGSPLNVGGSAISSLPAPNTLLFAGRGGWNRTIDIVNSTEMGVISISGAISTAGEVVLTFNRWNDLATGTAAGTFAFAGPREINGIGGPLQLTGASYVTYSRDSVPNSATFWAGQDITRDVTVDLLTPGSTLNIDSPLRVRSLTGTPGDFSDVDLRATNINVRAEVIVPDRFSVGRSQIARERLNLPFTIDQPADGAYGNPYLSTPTMPSFHAFPDTAVNAVGVVEVGAGGGVIRVDLLPGQRGAGYDPNFPPLVTITGGGGTGATARAIVSPQGFLTGIVVTNPGSGYMSAMGGGGTGGPRPTVVIAPPVEQRAATARVAEISASTGRVERIEVLDPGSRYHSPPRVILAPPEEAGGTRATARAILATQPTVVGGVTVPTGGILRVEVINPGSGYRSRPVVTIAEPSPIAFTERLTIESELQANVFELYVGDDFGTDLPRGRFQLGANGSLSTTPLDVSVTFQPSGADSQIIFLQPVLPATTFPVGFNPVGVELTGPGIEGRPRVLSWNPTTLQATLPANSIPLLAAQPIAARFSSRSDSLYLEAATADLTFEGLVNVNKQSYLVSSPVADDYLAPFQFTTRSPASGAQSGTIEGAVVDITLANDTAPAVAGGTAFNNVSLQTRIDSLRIRAASSVADPQGPFPYQLEIDNGGTIDIDGLAASGLPLSVKATGGVNLTSVIDTYGDVAIDAGTRLALKSPVRTRFGRISVTGDSIDIQNSLAVTAGAVDPGRQDIVIEARRGGISLAGEVSAVNDVFLEQRNSVLEAVPVVVAAVFPPVFGDAFQQILLRDPDQLLLPATLNLANRLLTGPGILPDTRIFSWNPTTGEATVRVGKVADVAAVPPPYAASIAFEVVPGAISGKGVRLVADQLQVLAEGSVSLATDVNRLSANVGGGFEINERNDVTIPLLVAGGLVSLTAQGPDLGSRGANPVALTATLLDVTNLVVNTPNGSSWITSNSTGQLVVGNATDLQVSGDRAAPMQAAGSVTIRARGGEIVMLDTPIAGGSARPVRVATSARLPITTTYLPGVPGVTPSSLSGAGSINLLGPDFWGRDAGGRSIQLAVGDLVLVKDQPAARTVRATVTAAAVSDDGTRVTYTAANEFVAGQTVSITGLSASPFNLSSVRIVSASPTQFTVEASLVGGGPLTGQSGMADVTVVGAAENGIYRVAGLGGGVLGSQRWLLVRDAAADTAAEMPDGTLVRVNEGAFAGTIHRIQYASVLPTLVERTGTNQLQFPELFAQFDDLEVGMIVNGAGIAADSFISAIDPVARIVTLDVVRPGEFFAWGGGSVDVAARDGDTITLDIDENDYRELAVGQEVRGAGILPGAVISRIGQWAGDRAEIDVAATVFGPTTVEAAAGNRVEFGLLFSQLTQLRPGDRIEMLDAEARPLGVFAITAIEPEARSVEFDGTVEGLSAVPDTVRFWRPGAAPPEFSPLAVSFGLGAVVLAADDRLADVRVGQRIELESADGGTVLSRFVRDVIIRKDAAGNVVGNVTIAFDSTLPAGAPAALAGGTVRLLGPDTVTFGVAAPNSVPVTWNSWGIINQAGPVLTLATNFPGFADLTVGLDVTGPNIPAGARVQAFDLEARTITLDQLPSGPVTAVSFGIGPRTGTYPATNTLQLDPAFVDFQRLFVGQRVYGAGIDDGAVITAINPIGRTITVTPGTIGSLQAGIEVTRSESVASQFYPERFDDWLELGPGFNDYREIKVGQRVELLDDAGGRHLAVVTGIDPAFRTIGLENGSLNGLSGRVTSVTFLPVSSLRFGVVDGVGSGLVSLLLEPLGLNPIAVSRPEVRTNVGTESPFGLATFVVSTAGRTNDTSGSLGKMIDAYQRNATSQTQVDVRVTSVAPGPDGTWVLSLDPLFTGYDRLYSELVQNSELEAGEVSGTPRMFTPEARVLSVDATAKTVTLRAGSLSPLAIEDLERVIGVTLPILTANPGQQVDFRFWTGLPAGDIQLLQELPLIRRAMTIDGNRRTSAGLPADFAGSIAQTVVIDGQRINRTRDGRTVTGLLEVNGLQVVGDAADGTRLASINIGGFQRGSAIKIENARNVVVDRMGVGLGANAARLPNTNGITVTGERARDVTILDGTVVSSTSVGIAIEAGADRTTVVGTRVGQPGIDNSTGILIQGGRNTRIGVTDVLPANPVTLSTQLTANSTTARVSAAAFNQPLVGLGVSGLGVVPGTTVAGIDSAAGLIVLSQPAQLTTTTTLTVGHLVTRSAGGVATQLQLPDSLSLDDVFVGQGVSGVGFAAGTVITAIDRDRKQVTLSAAVTSAGTGPATFGRPARTVVQNNRTGITVNGVDTRITNADVINNTNDGVVVGEFGSRAVIGTDGVSSTVAAAAGANLVPLASWAAVTNTTANSTFVTLPSSFTGGAAVGPGTPVYGPGIAAGTKVASVVAPTGTVRTWRVNLDRPVAATVASATISFGIQVGGSPRLVSLPDAQLARVFVGQDIHSDGVPEFSQVAAIRVRRDGADYLTVTAPLASLPVPNFSLLAVGQGVTLVERSALSNRFYGNGGAGIRIARSVADETAVPTRIQGNYFGMLGDATVAATGNGGGSVFGSVAERFTPRSFEQVDTQGNRHGLSLDPAADPNAPPPPGGFNPRPPGSPTV